MKSKCCNSSIHTETKGTQIGIYCDKCGKWQKWANKDDLRVIENDKVKPIDLSITYTTQPPIPNGQINITELQNKISYYEDSIRKLIKLINKEVDVEFDKMPKSTEDAIRKSSYTMGLDRTRYTLEDILNGEWK